MEDHQRALGTETEISFDCHTHIDRYQAVSAAPLSRDATKSFQSAPRSLLAFLRVYLGVILLITVLGKLTREDPFATEMLGFLQGVAMRRSSAWYLHFIHDVVIPHATLFSYLVMTGELFAGLSLLTGALTRVGAAVAMCLFLNFMLAKGRLFWSPDSQDAAVFFIALVVLLGRAGRVWGVDAYLAKRGPSFPLW